MEKTYSSPLLLVADDEVNTTIMLQHIFEREGYRVKAVTNGIAALETAKKLLPDVILLDILMPGMNGFDVLLNLREDERTANIPTIMVTANAREPADVARGLTLGADDYLYKPFAPQELLARVQSKIKARALEEALHRRTQQLEALLRASEKLNGHHEVGNLLEMIPELVLQLLPGEVAASYHVSDKGEIREARVLNRSAKTELDLQHDELIALALKSTTAVNAETKSTSSMAVRMEHADLRLGVLVVMSEEQPFEEHHLRLFEGLAGQAALALRNAQLYEIQADYAQHLEEKVQERTAELQSAQKLLIRSEKLASIGHLAASIAHEINNPLMPINIFLEDLEGDLKAKGVRYDVRELQMIRENVERIKRIVRSLLEFARDSGPELRPLDVAQLLEGVIKLNRKFFEHERVEIKSNLATTLPPVYGSKDQLEAVFMNLALNAEAAMENGGLLTINARSQQNEVVIDFIDTGCGIPADKIERIFDPFFSTKPNGTGLGLFLSYGIIEGHHGTITVKSKDGHGAHFTIRLPIHQPKV